MAWPAAVLACAFLAATGLPAAAPVDRFEGPIAPEVWALREDPQVAAEGAVILSDHWRLGLQGHFMERTLRIRIVGAAGLSAGVVDKVPGLLAGVEGRVCYPDGTFLALDKTTDLHEKAQFQAAWQLNWIEWLVADYRRTVLEIPGLTRDCVLELHLRFRPPESFGLVGEVVQNRFTTRDLVVELNRGWSYNLLFRAGQDLKPETEQGDGLLRTRLRDVPPLVEEPYSADALRSASCLYVFPPFMDLAGAIPDATTFWNRLAQEIWKEGWAVPAGDDKGKAYARLRDALLPGLPAGLQARARELLVRLNAKVRQWPRGSEAHALWLKDQGLSPEDRSEMNLEYLAGHGGATHAGWRLLYYNLLMDAGVTCWPVYAASVHDHPLMLQARTIAQFDGILLRVPEPGRPALYLDTAQDLGDPGRIPADYQGTEALICNPATWKPGVAVLPWQEPGEDVTELTYDLEAKPGDLTFKVQARFQGAAQDRMRRTYRDTDPDGVARSLAARLEASALDARVDAVEAVPPRDLAQPFRWSAHGLRPLGTGDRLRIPPFPVTLEPRSHPEFAPRRRDAIYLGPPRTLCFQTRLAVPKGWRWVPEAPTELTLPFARIRRAAHADASAVVVTVEVTTTRGVLPASDDEAFRRFLADRAEALEAPLRLERLP